MHYIELKREVCSIIKENDPYKASKQLQLEKWCYSFLPLFSSAGTNRLPFFLDILSDENCWEKTSKIHRVKLCRRTVAKKILELQNSLGKINPLNEFDRFQVASWCCLGHDTFLLLEYFKLQFKIKHDDTAELKKMVNLLCAGTWSDSLTNFWLHIASGFTSQLQLEGKHLYEFGLNLALTMNPSYVEAVEFFWDKIKCLPEEELSTQRKSEILMKTAIQAGSYCWFYPEVFEFCVEEMTPSMYPELLRRDFEENCFFHSSLGTLHDIRRFDLIRTLFDTFEPTDVSENTYFTWSTFLQMDEYLGFYASEAVKLFLHIWRKKGFNRHRVFVLNKLSDDSGEERNFLVRFAKENCMEPVWAVLNTANRDQIENFMNSDPGCEIYSILEEKGDLHSLNKFLSYKSAYITDQSSSTNSCSVVDAVPDSKRPRLN